MVDITGTRNYDEFSSIPTLFTKTAVAAAGNQGLNDVVLPVLAGSTITKAILELVIVSMVPQNNLHANLEDAQEIQIKEAAGAYIDAILLMDDGLKCPTDGAMNIRVLGSIDVTAQVTAFNKTYNIQWKDLNVEGDDIDFEVYAILKVWYTYATIVTDAINDLRQSTLFGGGTEFSVVNNGANTTLTFETDIPAAWGNDYFNDMQFVIHDDAVTPFGQARRISAFNAGTQFLTLDSPLDAIPDASKKFRIVTRWTPATGGLGNDWTAGEKNNIRQALGVAGTKAATSGGNLDDVHGKLPSKSYLRGTADADGGMDTEDKADIEAECGDALTAYDPPTRTEATADKDEIIVEVNANETKIDNLDADLVTHDTDIKALIGTPVTDLATDIADVDAQVVTSEGVITADIATHDTDIKALIGTPSVDISADIAANLSAIQAIQNNTRFTAAVPNPMQKPDAGNQAYRHATNLYDTQGDMEDPDNSEILVRIIKNDGTFITANLYKENALSSALDNPTDTGTFPVASGWRAMEREAVGKYFFFYKVASTETEEPLTVEFGWDEGGQVNYQSRPTKISDVTDDIEDILLEVLAIGVKVDSGTPSPTIPTQITTHDTDIKALQRVQACPDLMYVPSGRTQIDLEGGITAIAMEIPVLLSDNLLEAGIVKMENEYAIYNGITDSKLQITERGAYGTTPATHADDVVISQSLLFPIRLVIRDNEGNMLAPDSIPTIEVEDWNETQEIAPTAMTLKSIGIYGYNYIIDYGELAENKLFKFVTVIDSITAQHRHEVVIIDQPASSLEMVQYLGGGLGDYILDQDGWYDVDGVKTLWTDDSKGYVRDADTGAPLDDAYVTAYPIINGETRYSGRPTGQARTRVNGTWIMALDAGTYTFVIEKDGFRIRGDGVETRTVG